MKSNVGFFRKTNTADGRKIEEAEAEQRSFKLPVLILKSLDDFKSADNFG